MKSHLLYLQRLGFLALLCLFCGLSVVRAGPQTQLVPSTDAQFFAPSASKDADTQYATKNLDWVKHIGGAVQAVYVQGNYVYLGEGQALTILDISTPAAPIVVGKTILSAVIQKVYVSGDYAYLATGGLTIVDVSDPTNPTQVGFLAVQWNFSDMYVTGNTAYVLEWNQEKWLGYYGRMHIIY
jgi:hypothetical protein